MDSRGETKKTPRIGAVVLAAGGSTRLGIPKQLIELDGTPLVRRAAVAARDAGCDPVIVVTGADAERVTAAVSDVTGVTSLENNRWQTGIASSLALGIRALGAASVDAALISLCDQPLIDAHQLSKLLERFGDNRIVASSYDEVLGVPAVFGTEYFPELLALEGDRGAAQLLRNGKFYVDSVPMAAASLDIDTEEDATALRKISPA